MKWLLHSERFKNNLKKWIFMYVGVMLALTSVITYSRYISNIESNDEARAAKFDVTIIDICSSLTNVSCGVTSVRPTETTEFDYYFKKDTSELEVTTLLYTYIYVHKDVSSYTLYEYDPTTNATTAVSDTTSTGTQGDYNYIRIEELINPSTGSTKYYKLVINYNTSDYNQEHNYVASNGTGIARVEYSATQKK